MSFIIKKFFLLTILILLQSCSGGRIGNFLESSFKNIDEAKMKEDIKNNLKKNTDMESEGIVDKSKNIEETKIKEDVKNNLKKDTDMESERIVDKSKNIEEAKIKEDIKNYLKNKEFIKSENKSKNKRKLTDKNISFENRKYQPQSYKIIFILKDVDPKDPTEDLRTILRNSEVNFEIEKIERYFYPKSKSLKSN